MCDNRASDTNYHMLLNSIRMENTAKNFALQLGSLITLYVSLGALISVVFGVITTQYPDAIAGYWEYDSAQYSIRLGIALLIVFFPAYVVLTRLVNTIRRTEQGTYLSLTKWLIYLSLTLGGGIMLGDLVVIINSFLNGELTTRFILKALSFLIIVGCAFVYYLLDARNYWQAHEKQSIQYGIGMSAIVLAALVVGFMNSDTPKEVRETRLDATQITDLTTIQRNIESYYTLNGNLPESIEDAFNGILPPVAPEDRNPYVYTIKTAESFELCADFARASSKSEQMQYAEPMVSNIGIKNPYNWDHGVGNWCFERILNTKEEKTNPSKTPFPFQ